MNADELLIYEKAIDTLLNFAFDKIIESIKDITIKSTNKISIKTRKAFKKYLETAIKKYNELKTIFNPAEPVLLDSFYVNLDLSIGKNRL